MKHLLILTLVLFGLVSANTNKNIGFEPIELKVELLTIQMSIKNVSFHYVFNDGELEKSIFLSDRKNPFHVLITNNSEEAVIIWKEWCSTGYFNLYFEVLDILENRGLSVSMRDEILKKAVGAIPYLKFINR